MQSPHLLHVRFESLIAYTGTIITRISHVAFFDLSTLMSSTHGAAQTVQPLGAAAPPPPPLLLLPVMVESRTSVHASIYPTPLCLVHAAHTSPAHLQNQFAISKLEKIMINLSSQHVHR